VYNFLKIASILTKHLIIKSFKFYFQQLKSSVLEHY